MKKHVIAVAVASALSAPAMAQNVTVYGILDVAATDRVTEGVGSSPILKVKQRSTGNTSAYTTSRLGFIGTEDLGGGLRATFNYELGIAQNDATQAVSGNNSALAGTGVDSNFGNTMNTFVLRQANVGLTGGFGSLIIGRQTTAVEAAWGAGDVGGGNNFWGRAYTFGATVQTADSRSTAKQNNDRSDRLVTYRTPVLNGFQATLQYGIGDTENFTAGGAGTLVAREQKEMGISLAYTQGPLNLVLGHQSEESKGNTGQAINNGKPTQTVLGGSYNFGKVRVFGTYAASSNKSAAGAKVDDRDLVELGASVPMGALTLNASILDGKYKQTTTSTKSSISGYQLAALYSLSKRTMAYAVYGTDEIKDGDLTTGTTSIERSNFGIGIRHTF